MTEDKVVRLARGFAAEWLRPNDPEHATTAIIDTLSTAMLAFHAVARGIEERAACADQPWQPISTAPKDGRWFWAWRDTTSSRSRMNVSAFKWDSDDRGWFAGTGWWSQFPKTFTHWREMNDQPAPLPAPPSPAAKETL